MHLYRAYGTWIESAIELPWLSSTQKPIGFAPADLVIGMAEDASWKWSALRATEPIYRSGMRMPNGDPYMLVYRNGKDDLLQFNGFGFVVGDNMIEACLADRAQQMQVQVQLLGPVLAYWLERRGMLALHASAVVVDGVAMAFTTNSRGGKSTLAASFVHSGAALLTDDILPCRVDDACILGNPGFPSMRMWPAEAERFVGHYLDLELIHPSIDKRRTDVGEGAFGRFHNTPIPLVCIYQPMRRGVDDGPACIDITLLSRSEALVELNRMSFVGWLARKAFEQEQRLDLLARIAKLIPVKRLSYPTGYDYLPAVREAVLKDASTMQAQTAMQRITA